MLIVWKPSGLRVQPATQAGGGWVDFACLSHHLLQKPHLSDRSEVAQQAPPLSFPSSRISVETLKCELSVNKRTELKVSSTSVCYLYFFFVVLFFLVTDLWWWCKCYRNPPHCGSSTVLNCWPFNNLFTKSQWENVWNTGREVSFPSCTVVYLFTIFKPVLNK